MINRDNYHAVRAYLAYLSEVLQRDRETVANARWQLYIMLRWADDRPITQFPRIRPVFSRYLVSVPGTGYGHTEKPLGSESVEHACATMRAFLTWLRNQQPRTYAMISDAFLAELRPPRLPGPAPKEHQAVTLEIVEQLLAAPRDDDGLVVQRDQAAAAFLFLSGMRATAFCTLTLQCVDVAKRKVLQYPELGVRTKNQKAAQTCLLDIPRLVQVVAEWDLYLRTQLPLTAPWYPVLQGCCTHGYHVSGVSPKRFRANNLRDNLHRLFDRAGLPRMSPHKFRHGHALYGLMHAHDVSDFKAVSMNLMHANMGVTDGVYGILTSDQMQERIARLSQPRTAEEAGARTTEGLAEIVAEVLTRLRRPDCAIQRLSDDV